VKPLDIDSLGIIHTELKELFVADSESSSIRAVNLRSGGSRLLAGGDPTFPDNLFRVFLSFDTKDVMFLWNTDLAEHIKFISFVLL
jgi:hypothetical protein